MWNRSPCIIDFIVPSYCATDHGQCGQGALGFSRDAFAEGLMGGLGKGLSRCVEDWGLENLLVISYGLGDWGRAS